MVVGERARRGVAPSGGTGAVRGWGVSSPGRGLGVMRFATRGVHRLAYEVVASEGDADTPVVVLLHALLGERGDFAVVREMLRDGPVPVRLIIPDARGHGASAALANLSYSLDDMVAELTAILDAAGVEWVHLAGHDLGGATAFGFASARPERVRSLTLIEPALDAVLDQVIDPAVRSARAATRESDRTAADAAYKGMTDVALDRYFTPRRGIGWRDELAKPRLAALRRNVGALGGTLTALDGASFGPLGREGMALPIHVLVRENAPTLPWQLAFQLERDTLDLKLVELPPATSPLAGEAGLFIGESLRKFIATDLEGKG